jgi:parallel beta-helix repeat protein
MSYENRLPATPRTLLVSLIIPLLLLVSAGPASAAKCVNPGGTKGCYDIIQEAIDEASPGEKIKVAPGIYFQRVILNLSGLTLTGTGKNPGKVVIDGSELPISTNVVDIVAPEVTVKNLTIRNVPQSGIQVFPGAGGSRIIKTWIYDSVYAAVEIGEVHDILVKNCRFRGSNDALLDVYDGNRATVLDTEFLEGDGGCVYARGHDFHIEGCTLSMPDSYPLIQVIGDNSVVRKNTMKAGGIDGVEITGFNALVEENTVTSVDENCVEVNGQGSKVLNNTLKGCGMDGIAVTGANATIGWNDVSFCHLEGIDVDGINPVVKKNRVRYTGVDAYNVNCQTSCTSAFVSGNTAGPTDHRGDCFWIGSETVGLSFRNNQASYCSRNGFYISGDGMTITGNTSEFAGANDNEHGFYITGDGHTLEDNVSRWSHEHGFYLSTDSSVITGNKAFDNLENGFHVSGDFNTLDGNTARRNMDVGIHIYSSSSDVNSVIDNIALKNRIDYCDEGTGTIREGNDFGTECPP